MTYRMQKSADLKGLRAQAKIAVPTLDTRQGRIILPTYGAPDWAPDGTLRGTWGYDRPLRYVQIQGLGTRELTASEHCFAVRLYGPIAPC